MTLLKWIAFGTVMTVSMSAFAATKEIVVKATVSEILDLEKAGGGSIGAMSLPFNAGQEKLTPAKQSVTIKSNSFNSKVKVTLQSAAVLTSGSNTIPLKVSLGGKAITTTGVVFNADDVNGADRKAKSMDLEVGPATSDRASSGDYQGKIVLVLTHQP